MLNARKLDSLKFYIRVYEKIGKIKIYQELCHKIIAAIPKDNFDDVLKTIQTMHTWIE